jgi:hypothetical protein
MEKMLGLGRRIQLGEADKLRYQKYRLLRQDTEVYLQWLIQWLIEGWKYMKNAQQKLYKEISYEKY